MKEKDLYLPIKTLFSEMGYTVKGEVKDVDLVAISEDDDITIMVEFKLQLSFKLVLQAINRQRMTDFVYVAIPRPEGKKLRSKSHMEKIHLLRRLELGLIYVALDSEHPYAQIIEEPRPYDLKAVRKRGKKKKEVVIAEMKKRHGDYNLGGSKGKVMTSYKEQSLLIAHALKDGPKTITEVKEKTSNSKCGGILSRNFYKWFNRVETGTYELSDIGKEALITYKKMLKILGIK